jgi:hypothetical protein
MSKAESKQERRHVVKVDYIIHVASLHSIMHIEKAGYSLRASLRQGFEIQVTYC